MAEDRRYPDEPSFRGSPDWGERYRRRDEGGYARPETYPTYEGRRYGAGDYEYEHGEFDAARSVQRGEGPGRSPWPRHDPGHESPDYRDLGARRRWRGEEESDRHQLGHETDFAGWDAPFGGRPIESRHSEGAWDRLRSEARSFLDRTRDELGDLFKAHDRDGARRGRQGAFRGRGPRSYRRSDERIREDVNDRLTEDSWLDASDVEVSVRDGEVTLSGRVDTRRDKRRAEDLADQVPGVRHVQNNLRPDQPDRWESDRPHDPPYRLP